MNKPAFPSSSAQSLSTFKPSPNQQTLSPAVSEIEIRGPLDRELFSGVLHRIVNRHEVLRHGLAGMEILGFRDLAGLAESRRTALIERLYQAERKHRDHHSEFGFTLVRLSDAHHLLLTALPSEWIDDAGVNLIFRQLIEAYCKNSRRTDVRVRSFSSRKGLEPVSLESTDQLIGGQRFWAGELERARTVVELPFERLVNDQAFRPDCVTRYFDEQNTAAILACAAEMDVSVQVLTAAAWHGLLWRLTGRSVVVGGLFDQRQATGMAGVVGPFSRNLPVHRPFMEGSTFRQAVRAMYWHHQVIENRQVFFDWGLLKGRHGMEHYFPFCFAHSRRPKAVSVDNLTFTLTRKRVISERFDVRLDLESQEERIKIDLWFDGARYRDRTAVRLANMFREFLICAVVTPDAPVNTLNLMTETEWQMVLYDWNDTAVNFSSAGLIHGMFEDWALKQPDAVALIDHRRHYSFSALNDRANQLAHHLRALGVGPEVPVAVMLRHSPAYMVALLAVLKAGGCIVPLPADLPSTQLHTILADIPHRITSRRHTRLMPGDSSQTVVIDGFAYQGYSQENPRVSGMQPSHAGYMVFSTAVDGKPRGVVITHGQLSNYVLGLSRKLGITPGSRFACVSSLCSDMGRTLIFPALCSGGEVNLMPSHLFTDHKRLSAYLNRGQLDYMKVDPLQAAALMPASGSSSRLPRHLLVIGGESLNRKLLERLLLLPDCRVYNHFGPSEAGIGTSLFDPSELSAMGRAPSALSLPIGRPLANMRMVILDRTLHPVPAGVSGELYIGGCGLTRGYFQEPELTAQMLVPDPYGSGSGERLFRTGDVARFLSDGNIEFLGRCDLQTKIRGLKVVPAEVEAVLIEHEAIGAVVVQPYRGNTGVPGLAAYTVFEPGRTVDSASLRAFLVSRLPEHMIPRLFIRLSYLPVTEDGRIDRSALPGPNGFEQSSGCRGLFSPVEDPELNAFDFVGGASVSPPRFADENNLASNCKTPRFAAMQPGKVNPKIS